ncbi:MAG: SNF2-related protein, partial [candidate division Zixibacteria bacterium]|nr:SNF2-related protein [candidate division Zixibacteria bacterium]
MITSKYNFNSVTLYVYDDNGKLVSGTDNEYWEIYQGLKYEIKSLIDANIILIKEKAFTIPINTIYDSGAPSRSGIDEEENTLLLSPELMQFIEIPSEGDGVLKIESRGSFRSSQFRFIINYEFKDGSNSAEKIVTSPIITDLNGNTFILSREQTAACRIIINYEQNGPYDQENKFRIGGKIRRLTELGDVEITKGRIKKETIEDVETVRPKFSPSPDGGIDLGFDLESGNNQEFEDLITSSPEFQEIFTVSGEGTERKRYILGEEAKKAVNSFRKKSHFTKEERHLLLNQPEEYLDGFNLDDYSERVVGYGILYAPKISAFQGEDGTDWINIDLLPLIPEVEGAQEEEINNVKSLKINKDNAKDIKELIDKAEAQGKCTINIDGQEIIISDELKEIIDKKSTTEPSLGLITKSNIDEITHQEGLTSSLSPPEELSELLSNKFSNHYTLKPYQEYGYAWLNWARDNKFSGCLLADDMGMGKTIQIAAKLAFLKERKLLSPSLLIVPPILIEEWIKELGKFVPSITVYRVKGKLNETDIEKLKQWDLLATSYQSHLKNQRILGKISFKMIICDEVQFIKNPASARAQAVLAMNGEFKIASTATPIENSISELWSILDYSNPGYLQPLREFNKLYGDKSVSNETFNKNVEGLKQSLSPIVLRRTKEEYLKEELPEKRIQTHLCEIDDKQILLCRKITDDYKDKKTIGNFVHFFQMMVMALTNPELLDGAYDIIFPTDYISPKVEKTLDILD